MNQTTLDKLKIASNLFLALLLLVALVMTLMYRQDVQEALELKEPNRLVAIYENKTGTTCLCADKKYGSVIFIPIN